MNRRGFLAKLGLLTVAPIVAPTDELLELLTHRKVWPGFGPGVFTATDALDAFERFVTEYARRFAPPPAALGRSFIFPIEVPHVRQ